MKIKPVNDYVYIDLDPELPKETRGGIVLPDSVPQELRTGTVIAVGKGKQYRDVYRPCQILPGERVVFHVGAIRGSKQTRQLAYLLESGKALIRETDIFAVFGGELEVRP